MQAFTKLNDDSRFKNVTPPTKEAIIKTIGKQVEDSKNQTKFSEKELHDGLHYLLAIKGKDNPKVKNLTHIQGSSGPSSISSGPFYFGNNDPFFWYWMGAHSGPSHGGGGSGNCFGGGGGGGNGEGMAIALAAACVCAAGCCCVLCTMKAMENRESPAVKGAKLSSSIITGLLVTTLLAAYGLIDGVWHENLVVNANWDEAGYKAFIVLMSTMTGLFAGGTVSMFNWLLPCEQGPEELQRPSAEILQELEPINQLLTNGWVTAEGDNQEQCNEFVREVILTFIKTRVVPDVALGIAQAPAAPSAPSTPRASNSQFTTFSSKNTTASNTPKNTTASASSLVAALQVEGSAPNAKPSAPELEPDLEGGCYRALSLSPKH